MSLLLSHSHWFAIPVGEKRIRVCARCSGVIMGFLISLTTLQVMEVQIFRSIPGEYLIIVSITLALPAIVDWITQSWGMRESSNPLRLVTGIGEGLGAAILVTVSFPFIYKIALLSYIGGAVVIIGKKDELLPQRK